MDLGTRLLGVEGLTAVVVNDQVFGSSLAHVYVGLGSNLPMGEQSSLEVLFNALDCLAHHPHLNLTHVSSFYETSPVTHLGVGGHTPNYVNAVAAFETQLTPVHVLGICQGLEQAFGRRRTASKAWEPRTLDLDVLLYDDMRVDHEILTIPHAHLSKRGFVLYPLRDLQTQMNTTLNIPAVGALDDVIIQFEQLGTDQECKKMPNLMYKV